MNILTVLATALFFVLLGMAWVKGYDVVKRHDAALLPQFYMVLAAVRMVMVSALVLIYVLLTDDNASIPSFAIMVLLMYATMMIVSLTLKH